MKRDLIGIRHGRLKIIEELEPIYTPKGNSGWMRYFLAMCDCWNLKKIRLSEMSSGKCQSCWCIRTEKLKERMITHGKSKEKIYQVYQSMQTRINYTGDINYHNYWGRWIKCEWKSFEEFYKDMIESYNEHKKTNNYTSLERIDVNGNYSKSNCKRAGRQEQLENKRNNIKYQWITISERARRLWVMPQTLFQRLNLWRSIEETVTKPILKRTKKKSSK